MMRLSEDEVRCALEEIDILYQRMRQRYTSTSVMLRGMLEEYKYNIIHHLAGDECPCTDIDFVEVRSNGSPDFIVESKCWDKKASDWQLGAQKRVLRTNIPIFILEHHINTIEPLQSNFRINGGRILDFDEWREFLRYGRVPSESLEVLY